ncbi:NAD-dependent succinate-semialdehyde dehydrogenase [Formicincola oecophyllae]|uniref:NAD-dependent succinate-semialdehyde dehydrogenase n=1 Tax=Formicincola oecophyllae TaxID=2558361 RepID=A0A4Y6U7C8_9PROT|nr:NAD-dependent succinate-semialdehyde dehydrogenase [Formicincola oecophyllae]QDH13303.1 NAD-dependent succinate-semialdehyde dehydrogenase [Formicincola oecophyllae]
MATVGYATVNPYTGETLKTFRDASGHDVQDMLAAGHQAWLGWRTTPVEQRAALMGRVAQVLRANAERYAALITLEMGKLIGEAKAEIALSADIFDYYAQNTAKLLAPEPLPTKDASTGKAELHFEPLGIVFAVEPWNFPFYQVARVVAPQLAAGNGVLLKHAQYVPQCAEAWVGIMKEAGVPDALFQNIFLRRHHVEEVIHDSRICGVALTGGERAGAAIGAMAGAALKKCTMELGGSDPFIVLDDADVEKAAQWAAYGRHWNAGQVCVSAKRMIVVESVYDRFLELYKQNVSKFVAGDPMNPATTLAPMVSQRAADHLKDQVDEAKLHGAKVESLGVNVPEKGAFFAPLLMTGLEDNEVRHWEFFGPVTQLFKAKDEADAVRIANDSPYGLGGCVFTQDVQRGRAVAAQVATGMMFINHPTMVRADLPFGGIKNSGFGRELIGLGLKEFVNHKLVDVVDINAPF